MHDLICDCPFSRGSGECGLDFDPLPGTRKYPPHCPKMSSLRNEKTYRETYI